VNLNSASWLPHAENAEDNRTSAQAVTRYMSRHRSDSGRD